MRWERHGRGTTFGRRSRRRPAGVAATLLVPLLLALWPVAAQAAPSDPTDAVRLSAATLRERDLPGYAATTSAILPPASVFPGVGTYVEEARSQTIVGGYEREFIDYGHNHYLTIKLRESASHAFAAGMMKQSSMPLRSPQATAPDAAFGATAQPDARRLETGQFAKSRIVVTVTLNGKAQGAVPSADLVRIMNAEYARVPDLPDLHSTKTISIHGARTSLMVGLILALLGAEFAVAVISALRDRGSRQAFLKWWLLTEPSGPQADRVRWLPQMAHALRRAHRRSVRRRAVLFSAILAGSFYLPLSFTHSVVLALSIVWVLTQVSNLLAQRSSSAAGSAPVGALALIMSAVSSAATLALVGLALEAALIAVVARTEIAPSPDVQRQLVILFSLGLLALMAVAAGLDRLTRRLNARRADRALARDHRPEIVFLRSFGDDAITLRSRQRGGRSLIARLSLRSRETLEQLIAWTAWPHGPVVAVGEPGTHLPPLGATRAYYPDDRWQEEVERRIRNAAAVLLIAGRTQGLAWELNHVARLGALPKLIVLFPPLPRTEVQQRVAVVYGALNIDAGKAPRARSEAGELISLGFDPNGLPVFGITDARDDTSYLLALEGELQRIEEQGAAEAVMVHPGYLDVEDRNWQRLLQPQAPRPGTVVRLWRRTSGRLTASAAVTIWALNSVLGMLAPTTIPLPGTSVARTDGVFAVTASGTVLASTGRQVLIARGTRFSSPLNLLGGPVATATVGETLVLGLAGASGVAAVDASHDKPALLWADPLQAVPSAVAVNATRVAVTLPGMNQVAVLDRATGARTATIATGPTPVGVAFDGDKVLVTTAGDYAWTEYEPATRAVVRAGHLTSGASQLTLRGDDLYYFAASISRMVRYSLARSAVVGSVYVNGTGFVAFGQHTALACSDSPADAAVLVDLDRMRITSAMAAPSTPEGVAWEKGAYYFSFFRDPSVVRVPGT